MKWASVLVAVAACAGAPAALTAQSDLSAFAQQVAAAWARHDFATVVGPGRVELRIPGVAAAGPLPADQAVALLAGYAQDAEEVEVVVVAATAVSEVSGYAELRRRYRRRGVGDAREETILLGFARGGADDGGWRVAVVEASGARAGR